MELLDVQRVCVDAGLQGHKGVESGLVEA